MYQDKNLISSSEDELGYRSKDFKCTRDAIKLSKIMVGETATDVQEFVEELRNKSVGKTEITITIPVALLFKEGEIPDDYIELKKKASKWDALHEKVDKIYAGESDNEESNADLCDIGEICATALGYL